MPENGLLMLFGWEWGGGGGGGGVFACMDPTPPLMECVYLQAP